MNANLILFVRSFDVVLCVRLGGIRYIRDRARYEYKGKEMKKNYRNDRDNEMELKCGKYMFDAREEQQRKIINKILNEAKMIGNGSGTQSKLGDRTKKMHKPQYILFCSWLKRMECLTIFWSFSDSYICLLNEMPPSTNESHHIISAKLSPKTKNKSFRRANILILIVHTLFIPNFYKRKKNYWLVQIMCTFFPDVSFSFSFWEPKVMNSHGTKLHRIYPAVDEVSVDRFITLRTHKANGK